MDYDDAIKKYDMTFQKFLATNIDRRKIAFMIYGASRNGKIGNGYVPPKYPRVKPNSK